MQLRKWGYLIVAAPESPSVREFPDVTVVSRGRITASEVGRLRGAIGGQLALRGITGGARVRVTGGNCDRGPMVVQVNLQVGDTPARVQAVTPSRHDVLPAVARLDRHIERLSGPWRPRPLTGAGDGSQDNA